MKKSARYPAICSNCALPIDLDWVQKELKAQRLPVVHGCGRVLVAEANPGRGRLGERLDR